MASSNRRPCALFYDHRAHRNPIRSVAGPDIYHIIKTIDKLQVYYEEDFETDKDN